MFADLCTASSSILMVLLWAAEPVSASWSFRVAVQSSCSFWSKRLLTLLKRLSACTNWSSLSSSWNPTSTENNHH